MNRTLLVVQCWESACQSWGHGFKPWSVILRATGQFKPVRLQLARSVFPEPVLNKEATTLRKPVHFTKE